MLIAMMGSGGIGGYLGARLSQAGEDVSFIARGAHLEAMRRQGLRVVSPIGDITLSRVTATDAPADIGPVDIVVFAVKLYDSEIAAKAILPLVGPNTRVVTLQNGIDSVEILGKVVPSAQVVGGAIYVSAYLDKPGVVVHPGGHSDMIVGRAGDTTIEALRASCERAGGVDLQTVQDIDAVLWTKFVTLCAFSAGTSLMRAGVGEILANTEARNLLDQLLDEGVAVASAAGHPMDEDFKAGAITRFAKLPPETRSSMANDLQRGKPIEVEWLSGRMHTLGEKLGVPTPAHSAAYRALQLHARGSNAAK